MSLENQISGWLQVPKCLTNHFAEIEPFVHCYQVFSGVAGKCETCFASPLCRELNEDCMKFAGKAVFMHDAGYEFG